MLVADSDIVICNENASFFNPGVGVGIAAMVGQVLWAKSIPFHANMRIALMGPHERIDAQRAYELGIVTEVVRDKPLLDRAKEIAETMLRNSPAAMMAAKAILWNALEHGYSTAQEGTVHHRPHPLRPPRPNRRPQSLRRKAQAQLGRPRLAHPFWENTLSLIPPLEAFA